MSSSLMPFYTRKCLKGQYQMPFWNTMDTYVENVEMQQSYCEVDVYIDRNDEERLLETDEILNMTTYKCHVCNIDVPKTSAKDHIQSIKHQTCLKITKLALDRANMHMEADVIDVRLKIEVKDTYFCDACAFVVENSDKDKHDRSAKHVNSVRNDNLLQKLVKIYENSMLECEETVDEISENNLDQMLRKLMSPTGEVTEIVRNIVANENLAMNASNNEIKKNDNLENEEISKTVPKPKKKKNKKNKKKLINELHSNPPEIIVNTKEDGIEESKADFNKSIKNMDDLNIITSEVKTDEGQFEVQRKERDMKNNETQNSLNANNNSIKENDEKSKVLKTKYENLNKTETVNGLHVKELVAKTEENSSKTVEMQEPIPLSKVPKQNQENPDKNTTSKNKSENSHIIQENLDFSLNNKNEDSYNEQKHFLNVISKRFTKSLSVTPLCKDVVEIIANDGKKYRIPYLNFNGYRVCENNVVCRICPEWEWTPSHKWKEVHKINVMAPLDEHCVRKISEVLNHCILCNRLLLQFEIPDHVTSTGHNDYLQKYAVPQTANQDVVQTEMSKKTNKIAVKNNLTLTDDGAAMFCDICEVRIEKNRESILKHLDSVTHLETTTLFLEHNTIKKLKNDYYCVICEQGIWRRFLLVHCSLEKHMKMLSLMKKKMRIKFDDQPILMKPSLYSKEYTTDSNIEIHPVVFA